jgi:hypothetical protein
VKFSAMRRFSLSWCLARFCGYFLLFAAILGIIDVIALVIPVDAAVDAFVPKAVTHWCKGPALLAFIYALAVPFAKAIYTWIAEDISDRAALKALDMQHGRLQRNRVSDKLESTNSDLGFEGEAYPDNRANYPYLSRSVSTETT